MKILVCVKQVINPYAKVFPDEENKIVRSNNARYSINPFDEIAVEEAVRLKEKYGFEVIIVGIGSLDIQESMRRALAIGADRGILVNTDVELCTLVVSKIIAKLAQEENINLIVMGKQSTDGDHSHTGQMVAGLLDWPQGTFVSELTIGDDYLKVVREVDNGLETLQLVMPAVITVDLRLNEPRYPSLPNIIKAKNKPLNKINFSDLNIPEHTGYEEIRYDSPLKREQGIILSGSEELVDKLNLSSMVVK